MRKRVAFKVVRRGWEFTAANTPYRVRTNDRAVKKFLRGCDRALEWYEARRASLGAGPKGEP